MKVLTPEISWHNRQPTLSLDIAKAPDKTTTSYRVATGGNDCRVYIWLITVNNAHQNNSNGHTNGNNNTINKQHLPDIRIRAGLRRHHRSVGAVKFSSQHLLASGDDDGYIYIWKQKPDSDHQQEADFGNLLNEDGFEDIEHWQQQRVLRGHIEDICDLCWSQDGASLLSGSVDNSAILWDAAKGTKLWCSDLIKGYVQGVAIDPFSRFMAALSSDRSLRVYNFSEKKLINAVRRMKINKGKYKGLFCDDTVQTFCRRLEFSPDGQFLISPTSLIMEAEDNNKVDIDLSQENEPQEVNQAKPSKPSNALFVFKCTCFTRPALFYPIGREIALCCKFSPIVYQLREKETNFWNLPYRMVFAVALTRSVLIYDTQQVTPIGYISQIHLARLTDIAWSHNGRMLMISSYDGYCTIVTFEKHEFGEQYGGSIEPKELQEQEQQQQIQQELEQNTNGNNKSRKSKTGSKTDSSANNGASATSEAPEVTILPEVPPRKSDNLILKYISVTRRPKQ